MRQTTQPFTAGARHRCSDRFDLAVALAVADVAVAPEGLRLTIRRSEADQEGERTEARRLAVPAIQFDRGQYDFAARNRTSPSERCR
jgi:hypothetical protein